MVLLSDTGVDLKTIHEEEKTNTIVTNCELKNKAKNEEAKVTIAGFQDIGGVLLGCILLGTTVILLIFTGCKKWRSQKLVFSLRFREESVESRQRLLDSEEET